MNDRQVLVVILFQAKRGMEAEVKQAMMQLIPAVILIVKHGVPSGYTAMDSREAIKVMYDPKGYLLLQQSTSF